MQYEIKKATMPYFKPYVVVNAATKQVIYHCDNKLDAEGIVDMLQKGILVPSPPTDINTESPMDAMESRMKMPCGQKPPTVTTSIPGFIPERKIEI